MKFKRKTIVFISVLIFTFSCSFLSMNFIYAANTEALIATEATDLNLAKSYPKNKAKDTKKQTFLDTLLSLIVGTGVPISNIGVKLYFSENHEKADVTAKDLQKANAKLFQFYGPKNKKLKTKVYFSPKEKNYILAEINIGTKTLKSNTDYKLVIKSGLMSKKGSVLKTDETINFKTVNSDLSNKVYMGFMVVMFGGMFGFMALKKRRDNKTAAAPEKGKEEKVNPYLIAKKTGKPVEQVIKELEKKKAKQEKTAVKKLKNDYRGKLFKVKTKRNIRDFGSSYKTKTPGKQEKSNKNKKKNKSKKKKKR